MNPATPIRLFADAHVFDGPYQGTRTFIQGLYSELAAAPGVNVYLAAQDVAALRRAFGPVADRIHFLSYRSRSRYGRLLWEIPQLLRRHRIDYAHFQYVAPPRRTCSYIVTTHDLLFEEIPAAFPFPYRHLRRHLFRRSVLRADIRTTVSQYAVESITRRYGLGNDSLTLVPNAVTPFRWTPDLRSAARERILAQHGTGRYLLCVSRLEPRKNQQLLVKIFQQLGLARQGYQLVLIGSRSLPVPELDTVLAALDSDTRAAILQLQDVPDNALRDWYLGAELFLYPSLGEGFGIPPLEAALARVPVLCSDRTALSDFRFFGPDLVDPSDENAFAGRVAELLRQPTSEAVLKQRADFITEHYSWQSSAQLFLDRIRQHRAQNIAL
ncbi:MAG: glycosyltransferase family 1 protein [Chitinophagaceae bacterium]|nr:MAG: glycosyltransferase family 1 protein [Chitinophagaceae bacterium]